MMNRRQMLQLTGAGGIATAITLHGAKAMANTPVNIFIGAHQDDEIISLGSGIQQHLNAGQRVVVILATDGCNANVSKVNKHLGREATKDEVTVHRDFEFGWTCNTLGVEWAIAPNRGVDGSLSIAQARNVINWARQQYGMDARIKTHSLFDSHPDHANLGKALQQMYNYDQSIDARFYLPPHKLAQAKNAGISLPSMSTAKVMLPPNCIDAYFLWRPDFAWNRYWSVGSIGAGSLLRKAISDPTTYCHKPS